MVECGGYQLNPEGRQVPLERAIETGRGGLCELTEEQYKKLSRP